MTAPFRPAGEGVRTRLFQIIFESDTPLAKAFDIALIVVILASVLVVMLDTVEGFSTTYGEWFYWIEWGFTLLFTVELAIRLYILDKPMRYVRSFYGVIDIVAILPTWLMLLIPGTQTLVIVRLLRCCASSACCA